MIACGNIATLSLGEVEARRLELVTRSALGAGGGQIARQLLTESLLVGLLGSALGVLAAVAGHMHRKTKSGKLRPGQIEKDGVLYVNAAEVPRHRHIDGRKRRHHVKLTVTETTANAEDVWV